MCFSPRRTPSVTPAACQLPRRGSSRLRIKPRFQLLLLAYMRQREDHTSLLEGQRICCRLWRKQADGRSKKAGRFAPKDAAACVVPPYFTFPKKGMPLCAVSGAPSSLQSDLRHVLSPSRLAACGRLSLTAARAYSSFSTGTIYVSYYRRFSSDCQPHQRIYCRISIFFASVPRCSAT